MAQDGAQENEQRSFTLPISIHRLSPDDPRYMLYDIEVITWLRAQHHILGVLIGTLPQIPSQNVFLGLPLQLLPEEARWLVEEGIGRIVNGSDKHDLVLWKRSHSEAERERKLLRDEGLGIARDISAQKQARSEQVRRSLPNRGIVNKVEFRTRERDGQSSSLFAIDESSSQAIERKSDPGSNCEPYAITTTQTVNTPQEKEQDSCRPKQNVPECSAANYALFRHMHDRGFFMTPGLRFGCQFSIYPGDPLRFHSHFLACAFDWDEELDLLHLVGGGRLGTGVKKGWLIGGTETKEVVDDSSRPSSEKPQLETRTFCIEWAAM